MFKNNSQKIISLIIITGFIISLFSCHTGLFTASRLSVDNIISRNVNKGIISADTAISDEHGCASATIISLARATPVIPSLIIFTLILLVYYLIGSISGRDLTKSIHGKIGIKWRQGEWLIFNYLRITLRLGIMHPKIY